MKIDVLIVRAAGPYPGEIDPQAMLAEGFRRQGLSVAILQLCPPPIVPDVLEIHLDYRERVASGERWSVDVSHGYGVRNHRHLAFCEYAYTQNYLHPPSHEELLAQVPAAFAQVHDVFDAHDIRRVLVPGMGGEIIIQVVCHIAKSRGIPYLQENGTRYLPQRTLFISDLKGTIPVRKPVSFESLPAGRRKELRAYLEERRTKRARVAYEPPMEDFLGKTKRFLVERKFLDVNRLLKGIQTAAHYLNYERSKRLWERPSLHEPSVLYPLHSTVESAIILRSLAFFDQPHVIDHLLRTLPQDLKLFVKQHPAFRYEKVPMSCLKRVARAANASLLDPEISAWDLIDTTRAVITIHSTVGYEAVLSRRPVILLGRPPYGGWGVTWDVTHLDEIPAIYDKALHSSLTEEQVLDFLASFDAIHAECDWWYTPGADGHAMADSASATFSRYYPGS